MSNYRYQHERADDIQFLNELASREFAFEVEPLRDKLADTDEPTATYEIVASYAHESYMAAMDITEESRGRIYREGKKGATAQARILGYAATSWAEYADLSSPENSLQGLRQALKRKQSVKVPLQFLMLPVETNKIAERKFGILIPPKTYQAGNFRFENNDNSEPELVADQELFARATADLHKAYRGGQDKGMVIKAAQHCPAKNLVCRLWWPALVDLVIDTPEVVPRQWGLRPAQVQ